MCMSYHREGTAKMRSRLEAGELTFYKYYSVIIDTDGNRHLRSPIQQGAKVTIEDDGTIRSNRESAEITQAELDSFGINYGIHVYKNEHHCRTRCNDGDEIVVPVRVELADFVGCEQDCNHSIFTKVKVDKMEVERLMADATNPEDEEDEEDEDRCPDCGCLGCDGECMDDDDDDDDLDDEDDDDYEDEDDEEDDFDDDEDDDWDDDDDEDEDEDEDDE